MILERFRKVKQTKQYGPNPFDLEPRKESEWRADHPNIPKAFASKIPSWTLVLKDIWGAELIRIPYPRFEEDSFTGTSTAEGTVFCYFIVDEAKQIIDQGRIADSKFKLAYTHLRRGDTITLKSLLM